MPSVAAQLFLRLVGLRWLREGLGFKVEGFGFRVWGVGLRVEGSGSGLVGKLLGFELCALPSKSSLASSTPKP